MTTTLRKVGIPGLAVLGVSALALAGCAPAPEETDGPSAGSDYLACMVSDSGGFDDHSFNELGLQGLQDSGVEEQHLQSDSDDAYAPNIDQLVGEGCQLIVTVGFLLSTATNEAAAANPDVNFAIVDDGLDADGDGAPDQPNGKPILFDTVQAAFLGGYAAASYSKTGVVGTFGGIQIPPVTIFMDGFAEGVAYYNEVKGTDVQVVGWDVASQTGVFTGDFAAGTAAKNAAQDLLNQGADVLLPVGGPIYQSAAEAIRDTGDDTIALVGVDADVYNTDANVKDLLLTSVMKGVDAGVKTVVQDAAAGEFDNTPYVGTLENGGVGLAPFHDFEDKVDPALAGELDDLKAKIISGEVEATSVSSPK